ncbi:MAG: GNAT family N-acetyltransferase [Chloroflexi bacterium RBG_13_50_10]|nr:MAG: GNAT family N-acetyltransferase [Chloroflexi bacterium RBG_13_50_10]
MKVEKAKINDAQRIHELVNSFADKGEMLPRALSEIYENLRDFFVIRDKNNQVIGCIALHINWADLAEIKSLAVIEDKQAKGVGSVLVEACIDEARGLGIPTIFCLSYKPAFFEKHNFRQVDKMELPRKVWSECYSCPKFPDCDEVALIYRFER